MLSLIAIEILMFVFPMLGSWRASVRARKRLSRGSSPGVVIYRLNRFIRYMHALYVFPFLGISFVAWYSGISTHLPSWLHTALCLLGVVVNYTLLRLIYSWYAHPIRVDVLKVAQSRFARLWKTLLGAGGTALGYAVFYFPILLPNPTWVNAHQLLLMAYVVLAISVITLVGSKLTPWFLRAKRMDGPSVPAAWRQLVRESGLNSVRFYLWPTRTQKIANAMAVGIGQPTVIVTDYLRETLTPRQVDAVIAHELGHVLHRHVWLMFALNLAWIPLVMLFSFILHRLGVASGLTALASLGLYAVYRLATLAMSRHFEYQADAYASRMSSGADTMTSALESLHEAGKALRTIPWFDELWMTHPSLEHRIQRLSDRAPSSVSVTVIPGQQTLRNM